jgi:hypothetical protein
LLGLWPNPEESPREKLMSNIRSLLTFLMVIILLVPSMHALIRIPSNIMIILDNLQWTLPIFTSVIRLPIFWWRKKGKCSKYYKRYIYKERRIYIYKKMLSYGNIL